MLLSVIIVNYRVRYFLEQCLHSVVEATADMAAEILVVDNDPGAGSMAYLQPRFKQVQFIANAANTGFACANNLALRQARGRYTLFLNPDTLVPAHALQACLQALEATPHAAALGICMVDGSGQYLPESKRAFPSPAAALYKMLGLAALFPRSKTLARYYLGHLDPLKNQRVEVLAGAFMMADTARLQALQGFSEAYFMYGEDIDLSYRLAQGHGHNLYLAQPAIVHFKGESTARGSHDQVRAFYGAMGIFVRQHYPARQARLFNALIPAAVGLKRCQGWLGKRWPFGTQKTAQLLVNEVYMIGSAEAVASAAALLKPAGIAHTPIAHFAEAPSGSALVFCLPVGVGHSGHGTLAHCIGYMQQHPRRHRYYFHYAGSGSVVGSHHKASNGEALHLPS
jgi:GT2 family glycosyltransferase